MLRWLMASILALAASAGPVSAQRHFAADESRAAGEDDERPTIEDVREQHRALSRRPGTRDARDALAHAHLALERAEQLAVQGRLDASERAVSIAWAALVLASRQMALAAERRVTSAARRRALAAESRSARAREALDDALRQRARSLEPQRGDADAAPAAEPADDDPGEPE